jgi:cytochrome b561
VNVAWAAAESYDPIAPATHWLIAALAVTVASLDWAIAGVSCNTPACDFLLLLHRSIGLTIVCGNAVPGRVGPVTSRAAAAVEYRCQSAYSPSPLLYLRLILMPLAGYVKPQRQAMRSASSG